MTYHPPFIENFKKLLQVSNWSWVFSALTQDPHVWSLFHDQEFGDIALEKIGSNPQSWTPANLGLIRLGLDALSDQLVLDANIREKALAAYECYLKGQLVEQQDQQFLEQGLLIAIALLEHQRLSDSCQTVVSDLEPIPQILWPISLACLYGLVPDRSAFLGCLLSSVSPHLIRHAAFHAFLSNPQPPSEQTQLFREILESQPMSEWVPILHHLEHSRPKMVTELAKHLLSKQPTFANRKKLKKSSEQVNHLSYLIALSELERMAGQKTQGKTLHNLALSAVQDLYNQLDEQTIEVTIDTGNLDEAINEWENRGFNHSTIKSVDTKDLPPDNLILSLLESNRISDALELLLPINESETSPKYPTYHLIKAHQSASDGDLRTARKAAILALINSIEQFNETGNYLNNEIHPDQISKDVDLHHNLFMIIAKTLLELDLPEQALQAAQILVERCPNDAEVLYLISQAQIINGEITSAVKNAHLATALKEDRWDYRQHLALCLQAAGGWDESLKEWHSLLEKRFSPNNEKEWPPDSILYSLANCANKAGDYNLAKDTCQRIIEKKSQDGIAHTLLGEALLLQGEIENALVYFHKGTELASQQAITWLKLAEAQKEKGLPGNAVDTLRQAVQDVPEDPLVHLALAELYLEENALTQALTSLQHARGLITQPLLVSKTNPWEQRGRFQQNLISLDGPLPSRVAMLLGDTLRRLGHLEDARQVLEDAHQDYPGSIDLAKTYAKTLLSIGEHQLAINPLKIVVNSNPDEVEPYIEYAEVLLTTKTQPDEAVEVLHKAQEISPKNHITTALLAEALDESGDYETSQQTYYQALQSDLSNDEKWHSRLSFGLGKVSLKLSQPEIAIASLQESIRTNPDNPFVYQALANSFASLDLMDEALEAGQNAINLSPDDLEMLSWYSSLAVKMGSLDEAISSLERYVEIKPDDTAMIVQLGMIQSTAGRENDARNTLKQILSMDDAEGENLHKAAMGLLQLNDPDSAATFLEKAISKFPEPDSCHLVDLADAYKQAGRSHQAIETLDKALNLDKQNPNIYLAKSDLLYDLGRTDEVKDFLISALNLHSDNPNLRIRLIHILRAEGDLINALSNAEKLVATFRTKPRTQDAIKARTLAAELARAMLKPQYAREFLLAQMADKSFPDAHSDQNRTPVDVEKNSEEDLTIRLSKSILESETTALFSHYCLAAELALDEGEEVAAAEALNQAIEYNPSHPRLLALQARLANRRGDIDTAAEIFENALESISSHDLLLYFPKLTHEISVNNDKLHENKLSQAIDSSHDTNQQKQDYVCTLLGISAAAVELGRWDFALTILQKIVNGTEVDPYTQFQIARSLVLRAEYQNLCQALDVIQHAPGEKAVGKEAFKSFQNAIQAVKEGIKDKEPLDDENSYQTIEKWLSRGNAAFNNTQVLLTNHSWYTNNETISNSSSDDTSDMLSEASFDYLDKSRDPLQHSLSLAQMAMAYEKSGTQKEEIERGIRAASFAVNRYSKQPVFHSLLAFLKKRIEDYPTALNSMLTALSMWPEEPRWHAITAQLYLNCGNTLTAIDHLYKAVELEPGYMKHHLALGEALSINGDHQLAIESLKQAHRLTPENLEPNLALARAYIMNQDPGNATIYAEQAIKLAPDTPEPLQLLSEIALQSGDPKVALSNAKAALHLNPNHPDTLCLMARALSKMDQYNEALSVLETAIPLSPNPLPILLERTKLLETSQGSATALDALKELVRDYPNDPAVLANLARNLAAEDQNQEAIQAAQNALQRKDGNWQPGEQAKLYLLLGGLLRQAGQLDQAIHHLTEAIRLSPQDVEPYLELAATQQDRRQHVLALQTYQKAIEVAPNNPLPYYQASLALKDGRDYEGAERMLRKAANLAPNDVSIHRQLAALIALNLVHNQRSIPIEA